MLSILVGMLIIVAPPMPISEVPEIDTGNLQIVPVREDLEVGETCLMPALQPRSSDDSPFGAQESKEGSDGEVTIGSGDEPESPWACLRSITIAEEEDSDSSDWGDFGGDSKLGIIGPSSGGLPGFGDRGSK